MYLQQEQRSPLKLLWSAWRLALFSRRERPDVLHAHMMSSALVGYIASRLSDAPLVTTVHNSFDKHSGLMRLGDRVVAVSVAERSSLCKSGYDETKVDVVRNAPDHSPREAFMNNPREFTLARPCILAANGLHPRKNVSDLIEACAMLFPTFPEWHLYVAGEGPYRKQLEAEVLFYNLSRRVTFLGFVPSPRTLMTQADIFVLASSADPCSLAIGEARAAGCAIVATAVGGTPEMLDYGAAGRLVPPHQPRELAEQLASLMGHDDLRHELQRAAQHGSEVFDVEHLSEGYLRVYRKVLDA
jgi:glycosyltransferase involved in cell wall biosynthesis